MERLTVRDDKGIVALVCREDCKGGPACFACEQNALIRLSAYEDTGLGPEEIADFMHNLERAEEVGGLIKQHDVDHLKKLLQAEEEGRLSILLTREEMLDACPLRNPENGNCGPAGGFCNTGREICKAMWSAYNAGRFDGANQRILSENSPLTLEQLREMDGEPVWIVGVSAINKFKGHWDICDWENGEVVFFPYCTESPDIDLLGKTWLAYRRKPEEGTT